MGTDNKGIKAEITCINAIHIRYFRVMNVMKTQTSQTAI